MMRILCLGTVLAATLAVSSVISSAMARVPHVHHNFCLKTGSGQNCAFDTMAQCEAAKHGNADLCIQNSPTVNH